MKRFFLFLALLAVPLIAILAVNDAICLWLVRNSPGMSAAKVERFYNGCKDDEVIILGSSLARRGLIPSEIAPKCYNYGEDGSFFYEKSRFFSAALKMPNIKTIIYVVDPWGMTPNTIRENVCEYVLAPSSDVLTWYESLPWLRFFASFRNKFKTYNERKRISDEEYPQGAAIRSLTRTAEEWNIINAKVRETRDNFLLEDGGDKFIRSCLSGKGNAKIVFVIPPASPIWREVYDDHDKLTAYVSSLTDNKTICCFDFFLDKDFGEDDFFDKNHLNKQGALKFSSKLREAITAL